MIITKEMVMKAIELTRPSAELVLNTEGTTWGPRYVNGYVLSPGLSDAVEFTFGDFTLGQEEFWHIAKGKLATVARTGRTTDAIVSQAPWLLEDGEYLYAGGITEDGISVAISGAEAQVDEALSWLVLNFIVMLAKLEASRRIAADKMQI